MTLEITDLTTYYDRSRILTDVTMDVADDEIVALLGRNGVGKTTLLKSIMNLVTPASGTVRFDDEDITGLPRYEICRRGIGYVPQERDIFTNLSIKQNLELPLIALKRERDLSSVYEMFPVLEERRNDNAGNLSGGQQQMLAIGRALSFHPDLLLLDEPSEGIQPTIVNDIRDLLIELRETTAILLVEQNVDLVRSVADRCYVMENGEIMTSGTPDELDLEALVSA